MSNNTITILNSVPQESEPLLVSYYPLCLIIVGTFLNSLTFLILCQSTFKNTQKQPTIHYMRAIAIFDIFMLYGWNLNHYLLPVHGFTLLKYSILSCKLDLYFGYSTTQISAWLRVFVCLDRYLLLSRLHRTWFSQSKHVLIIITGIIFFFALFNLHLPIFNCFYTSTGVVNIDASLYSIFPLWDYIQIAVYNCLPFFFMMTFNSGVIYHLIYLRRKATVRKSRSRNLSVSVALVCTTFLFLIMTIPGDIVYTFFYSTSRLILLQVADATMFTYHITSFPLYFLTLKDFRSIFFAMIGCKKIDQKSQTIFSKVRTT